MGRSYSEYPFHQQQPMLGVQGSGPRLGNDEDKQKLGQQKATLPDAPVRFRQPHAETIQRLQQRRAARKTAQGGAGGGRRVAAKKAPAAKKATASKKSAGRTSAAAKTPARGNKTVARLATAAKTTVRRMAKKVGLTKGPKTR
jgi:DNA-binding protein HU-beta